MKARLLLILSLLITLSFCQAPVSYTESSKGKLFVIGGGKRPVDMVREMIRISGTDTAGYIVVLPMASNEPDTSGWYGKKQFTDLGVKNVVVMNIQDPDACPTSRLDSLSNAALIYITGGDQSRFMDIVLNTAVYHAIHAAFINGSVIAGTSAGAAVMSEKMITGNEYKYPEYTGDFRTIEAENMEIKQGLGLMQNAIVDQHFVWRMRMNRLISVSLENPGDHCFGIDESTALVVDGNTISVYGESQVVHLLYTGTANKNEKGLLGGRDLVLNIYLPGDTISLSTHP